MEFFANLIGGVQTGGARSKCPKCKRGLVRSNACVSKVERHNQIMNALPASQVQFKRASDALREKIDAVLAQVAEVHREVYSLSKNSVAPLKGKNNDDLAPMTTLIFLFTTPLQIISLFFLVIPECQIAGLKPKNSVNFFSNCPVKPISGNKIKP